MKAIKSVIYIFIVSIFLSCSISKSHQAYIYLDCGDESGMAYVQGYEYDEGCEFTIKDSCRVKRGRGELQFTMNEDNFVMLLIVTENHRFLDELPIGPNDTVFLDYTGGSMGIRKDRRRYGNEYTRFKAMKDSIRCLYTNLHEQIYNVYYGSSEYKRLEDSINLVNDYYYNKFPYDILNDPELSQSVYIVHNAIAIRSIARASLSELDSLRITFTQRLPNAKSLIVKGEFDTKRSERDKERFFELLNKTN